MLMECKVGYPHIRLFFVLLESWWCFMETYFWFLIIIAKFENVSVYRWVRPRLLKIVPSIRAKLLCKYCAKVPLMAFLCGRMVIAPSAAYSWSLTGCTFAPHESLPIQRKWPVLLALMVACRSFLQQKSSANQSILPPRSLISLVVSTASISRREKNLNTLKNLTSCCPHQRTTPPPWPAPFAVASLWSGRSPRCGSFGVFFR